MEIGVGIFGYGFMGKTHTYGLVNLPLFYNCPFKVKHISICNPSPGKREKAAATGCYRRVTQDYRELIDDPEIDAVCVASPNGAHLEQLKAAIQANKHIYCDKPVVANVTEAGELETELRNAAYSGKHQMVLQYRFFPAVMRARQLVEAGFLGRIAHYRAAYLHSSNIDPNRPLQWKSDPRRGGGGVFFDMGVHAIDLMSHLVGEVEAVNAESTTFHGERPSAETGEPVKVETDDATLALVRHANGAVGTVEASKIATGSCDELKFEIHAEHGAIRFNLMDPNWLEVYDMRDAAGPLGGNRGFKKIECLQQYGPPATGFPSPKAPIGWLRAHMHCMFNFLECIAQDRGPVPSLHDGIYLQRVLHAVELSAQRGTWVTVG